MRGVPPQRLWWMEMVRGSIAIAFGLLFLAGRSFASSLLIYGLGIYLIVDGFLELYGIYNRKIACSSQDRVLDSVGGIGSLLLGLLCLLLPHMTLLVLTGAIACYLLISGLLQIRMAKRIQGGSLLFQWISGSLLALFGLFLLLFPSIVITFFVLFLGSYMLVAGSSLLFRGVSLRFLPRHLSFFISQKAQLPPILKSEQERAICSALVFVRRRGANGLGHIGWGFEWENSWYYVGSVENSGRKPFARPKDMGFWCLQTVDPITTMYTQERSYDEYKRFCVVHSHPEAAWKMLAWEHQEPYSFVHHNCCDVAYEILRAYGCSEVLDPAQEYIPNDWYDALPGTSSSVAEYCALFPVSELGQAQPPREIIPRLPSQVKSSPLPWYLQLRRPWEELFLMMAMMSGHVRTRLTSGVAFIAQHLRHTS
jgi:uncharacterized membrane protein HdeD (DUF308 family)